MRRALGLAAALFAALVPAADGQVRLHQVGGFDQPVYVTGAPGDYSRLYVLEQTGRIRVVRDGTVAAPPFADLTGSVQSGGERGLLGLAFRPDFQRSRLLYVYFTDAEGDIRVEELRAPNPDAADPAYRRPVLEIPHRDFANHNGGTLQFGPDGFLYLATGDGGGNLGPNAQNLDLLLGKVLRIAPRRGGGYDVPADNPFVGRAGARGEIWAFGLRNPYRFSFDRATGDLLLSDVGASSTEEINYAPSSQGRGRGANFGWPACEGSFAQGSTSTPCPLPSTLPVIDQFSRDGFVAIIGGYVARHPSLGGLNGRYVYGDLGQPELRSAVPGIPRATDDRSTGLSVQSLTSLGEDTAGCLYAMSLQGPVYRLVGGSSEVPCRDPAGPTLKVRVPRRQRLGRRRGPRALARCNEDCTVSMLARVVVGRRSFRLRRVRRSAAAGRRVVLRARLTPRASRALRRRRGRARISLRARDAAGNASRLVRRRARVRR